MFTCVRLCREHVIKKRVFVITDFLPDGQAAVTQNCSL